MSADRYVDGGSIRWELLAQTAFGTVVSLVSVGAAEFIGLVELGLLSALSGLTGWTGSLISAPFTAAGDQFSQIAESTSSALAGWGVLAFALAVVLVSVAAILTIWGALWGVRRFVG
jgi:hypothetical protein